MTRGSAGGHNDANDLLEGLWLQMALRQAFKWWERVSPASNVADLPSRGFAPGPVHLEAAGDRAHGPMGSDRGRLDPGPSHAPLRPACPPLPSQRVGGCTAFGVIESATLVSVIAGLA